MSTPRWAVGMEKIGPGMYVRTSDNTVHFDAPEICAALGFPSTQENQKRAIAGAMKAAADVYPGIKQTVVDDDIHREEKP